MVFTDIGRSGLALLIAGSAERPTYMAFGIGSTVIGSTTTDLHSESGTRKVFSATDTATAKQIGFTASWGSTEMSGCSLTEVGVYTISSGGKLWSRSGFPAVSFDGLTELQVQVKYKLD